MIGDAAAAANLLFELRIPEKKEDRLTNNRNGNVILKLLGTTGTIVIQRVMGLILMVIAVQFVINGVMSIYKPPMA